MEIRGALHARKLRGTAVGPWHRHHAAIKRAAIRPRPIDRPVAHIRPGAHIRERGGIDAPSIYAHAAMIIGQTRDASRPARTHAAKRHRPRTPAIARPRVLSPRIAPIPPAIETRIPFRDAFGQIRLSITDPNSLAPNHADASDRAPQNLHDVSVSSDKRHRHPFAIVDRTDP